MGQGYNRTDTTNNIATGNIINASDLDAEYDAIDAAFDETTGHDHGGASGNGAPITKVGPVQDLVVSTTSVTPKTTNTLDLGTPLLKFKDLNLAGNALIAGTLGITGNTTFVGAIISDSTTDSTSTTTGAIQTDGGLGVAKALWVGGLANIAGAVTLQSTLGVTGVTTFTAQPILSSLTASRAVFTDGSKGLVSNALTGTGNVVMSASPTLTGTAGFENITASGTLAVTGVATLGAGAILNTPASVTLTNATGLPISSGVSGLGTGVATALAVNIGSAGAPVLFNGALGTPSSGTVTNLTGTASININGTVGATTANTGAFTNLSYTGTLTGGTGVVNLGSGQFYKDASGNIGVGTASPSSKLDVNGAIKVAGDGSSVALYAPADQALRQTGASGGTWYFDVATGGATNGSFVWRSSNSYTERMRIDSSGNVGIGTSSPWSQVSIGTPSGGTAGYFGVKDTIQGGDVRFGKQSGVNNDGIAGVWTNNNFLLYTNSTERMRIDSSGNVGIGTGSPSNILHLKRDQTSATYVLAQNDGSTSASTFAGFAILEGSTIKGGIRRVRDGGSSPTQVGTFAADSEPLAFWANAAERMRIDSSGNLLVGTTINYGKLSVETASGVVAAFRYTSASAGKITQFSQDSNNTFYIQGTSGGVYLTDTGVAWITNSDERLKTELTPFKNAVEKVVSLRSGTGRYLTDDDSVSRSFLIAQDVQKVLPEAVNVQPDEQRTLGLAYTDVIPLLVAAIQELKAEIDLLKGK